MEGFLLGYGSPAMAAGRRSSSEKKLRVAGAFGLGRSFTAAFRVRALVQEEIGRGEGPNGTSPAANGGRTAADGGRKLSGRKRAREKPGGEREKKKKKEKRVGLGPAGPTPHLIQFRKLNILK